MPGLPSLSALPPAPSRADDSTTFSAKADAFVAALIVMVAELNEALAAIPEIAAAVNYNTTSNSNVTVGLGTKVFAVPAGGILPLGQFVMVANANDPANYMAGQVTAHDDVVGTLEVDVYTTGGAGTFNSWIIAPTVVGDIGSLAPVAFSGDGGDLVNSSVTLAKLQNVNATTLIGRSTAGVGSPESITIGAGLSLADGVLAVSGGTLTLADGDYGDIVVSGSGASMVVDSKAITYAKFQDLPANSLFGNSAGASGTGGAITCTAAGRALLDDADAAAQRTTLGLGSIATMAEMTAAEFWANTADKALSTDSTWSAAVFQSLAQAATIAVNMGAGINFTTTMTGNRTLGNPSNAKEGQSGTIEIKQDTTGNRTLTYASNWKFAGGTVPTLSTAANAKDLLTYQVLPGGTIFASLIKDVK